MSSLLPPTCSEFELALGALSSRYEIDNPTSVLWNPDLCPEHLLIYLAWALSVDYWDEDWSEEVKRNVCRSSLDIHRLKGTNESLQKAMDDLGYGITIELWTQNQEIPKGKFRVIVKTQGELDERFYNETLAVIDENKRGTLHLDKFGVTTIDKARLHVGCFSSIGENIVTLPMRKDDIIDESKLYVGSLTITREVISTKPL